MDDLMILNMAFLLRKEMESEFDQKVQYLDQTFLGEVFFKLPDFSLDFIHYMPSASTSVTPMCQNIGYP
jgi:hypothetical protein